MSGFLDQIQWQLLNNLMFSEKFPESNEISGYCLYLWKLKKRAVVFKLITRASYVLRWNSFGGTDLHRLLLVTVYRWIRFLY